MFLPSFPLLLNDAARAAGISTQDLLRIHTNLGIHTADDFIRLSPSTFVEELQLDPILVTNVQTRLMASRENKPAKDFSSSSRTSQCNETTGNGGSAAFLPTQEFSGDEAGSTSEWQKRCTPLKQGCSDPIFFYEPYEPFGEFCNFYPAPFVLDGIEWATSEHYYQAQKFVDRKDVFWQIVCCQTPRESFEIAHANESLLRPDWPEVKEQAMLSALRCKFSLYAHLRRFIMATHPRVLIEHTASDTYWGDGGDGSGRNRLGHCLMMVRDELLCAEQQRAQPD